MGEGDFEHTYPYLEEHRGADWHWLDRPLLRPSVLATVTGPQETSDLLLALVDSGCDHVLVPEWMAMRIGIELDDRRSSTIRIGGSSRRVQFAEATLNLAHPQTEVGESTPDFVHNWTTLVGFMDWPPLAMTLLILGQAGFFDEFTVTMSRHSQALTVSHQEDFDSRYESPIVRNAPVASPRFEP